MTFRSYDCATEDGEGFSQPGRGHALTLGGAASRSVTPRVPVVPGESRSSRKKARMTRVGFDLTPQTSYTDVNSAVRRTCLQPQRLREIGNAQIYGRIS